MTAPNQLENLLRTDPEAKLYFEALPPVAQETVRMSGISFESCADMKNCVDHFLQKD